MEKHSILLYYIIYNILYYFLLIFIIIFYVLLYYIICYSPFSRALLLVFNLFGENPIAFDLRYRLERATLTVGPVPCLHSPMASLSSLIAAKPIKFVSDCFSLVVFLPITLRRFGQSSPQSDVKIRSHRKHATCPSISAMQWERGG